MASVPIACSLTANDADTRVEEWRRFMSQQVVEVARSHRSARLRLQDGDDAVLVATGLARREKACCPFFEFRLALLADAVWLEVEAPDEAAALLDELVKSPTRLTGLETGSTRLTGPT